MNNIDILEEKIKIIESLCTDDCINKETVIKPLKFAISNLISENKELKERNKRQQENLKITNKKIAAQRGQLMMLNKAYIPKSKVEEKIQDLKENNNGDDYNLTNVIMILQSLLGKG